MTVCFVSTYKMIQKYQAVALFSIWIHYTERGTIYHQYQSFLRDNTVLLYAVLVLQSFEFIPCLFCSSYEWIGCYISFSFHSDFQVSFSLLYLIIYLYFYPISFSYFHFSRSFLNLWCYSDVKAGHHHNTWLAQVDTVLQFTRDLL